MTEPVAIRRYTPLAVLIERLEEVKAREARAKQDRIDTEQAILLHPAVHNHLKGEGTTRIERIKIVTGYNRNWDQDLLDDVAKRTSPALFPFKNEWKEQRAKSRKIETLYPDHWTLFRPALTLTDKKPTVTIEEK